MATLLEKAQSLASASLPAMLDRALRTQTLDVLDQYIRRVQDSLADLSDAESTIGDQVQQLRLKAADYDRTSQDLDRNVDSLLLGGRDDLALSAQIKLDGAQDMAREYRSQYQDRSMHYQQILDVRLTLEAKLTAIRQDRQDVQALIEAAVAGQQPAPEAGTKHLEPAPPETGAARIAGSLRARLQGASDLSQTADTDHQIDRLLSSTRAETQVRKRKHRLGLDAREGTSGA